MSVLSAQTAALASTIATPEISVIIPVQNERNNLTTLINEIISSIAAITESSEIIAVDDGSTDGSRELLLRLAEEIPSLRVIVFRRNYGQAAAIDAGFRASQGRIIVTMDADGQNDPADIPNLIELLERDQLDMVSGRRAKRKDSFLPRMIPSRIANFLIRRVTGTHNRDLGCALKVYRRHVIDELHLYGEMHRFIAVLVEGMGARTGEIDVNHRARTSGKSKYGIARTFKVLLDLITVWFMRGFQTKPIYVFGGIGMLLMSLASALSGFVLYQKFFDGVWVHRNPVFILSMVMAIMAVQFLGMGLIAEITVRTYFESQRKSPYLIAARKGFDRSAGTISVAVAQSALQKSRLVGNRSEAAPIVSER